MQNMWYNYRREILYLSKPGNQIQNKQKLKLRLKKCSLRNWMQRMQRNILRVNKGTQYKGNIKIEENRKLNVLKHLYQCSRGKFKIVPIYQTVYMLLPKKGKEFYR